MRYDDELDNETPPELCVHHFENYDGIIRTYSDSFCQLMIEHGQAGLLIESFSGRYNVCSDKICEWLSDPDIIYDDFKSAHKISVSACIHYWSEELIHAVAQRDWAAVAGIKAILADIMKSMPKGLREGMLAGYVPEDAESKAKSMKMKEQSTALGLLGGTGG